MALTLFVLLASLLFPLLFCLGSMKAQKNVYEQSPNGLFFLSSPSVASEHIKMQLKKLEKEQQINAANANLQRQR